MPPNFNPKVSLSSMNPPRNHHLVLSSHLYSNTSPMSLKIHMPSNIKDNLFLSSFTSNALYVILIISLLLYHIIKYIEIYEV